MAVTSTVMAVAAVVGAVAAVGSGVMSYIQAGRMAGGSQDQSAYARAMAARNQQLAEYAAQNAEKKGEYEAGLARERQKKLLSKQISLAGASGVDMYGSPLEVMGQSYAEGDRDINTILYNAHYDAWKYRTSGETSLIEGNAAANRYDQQADAYKSQGTASLIGGLGSAGTSILTGYGRYKYYGGGGITPGSFNSALMGEP
jgi:hypothetical protein